MATRLKSAGIDTPPTRIVIPAAGLPADWEYPAVLKPVDGAGSLNTFLVANHNSVPLEAHAMPVAVLQPFVSGEPMSASFLVGDLGEAFLIGIGAQRMAIRDGRFEYLGGMLPVFCPGTLAQLEPAIASIPGLRVRRHRFRLGHGEPVRNGAGDQSQTDDLVRGTEPAAWSGYPGPSVA